MEPHASRTTQFFYLAVGLAVIGALIYFGMRGQRHVVPDQGQGSIVGVGTTSWASAEIDQKVINEKGDHYEINASYPITANSSVNGYFKSFVEDQVAAFKADSVPTDFPEDSYVQVYTINITYRNERALHADNYIFTTAIDTGGAHGLQATKTFSFTEGGKLIGLRDLFTTGVSGLTTIAPYVKAQLATQEMTNPEWIDEGAAPTELNYQNFVITDTGVRFMFDPYQVAAYAAGMIAVEVPVSEFKAVANKEIFQ